MRWIFWLLLLANAAFFAWHIFFVESAKPALSSQASTSLKANATIPLLSELGPERVRERIAPQTATSEPALCRMVGTFASAEEAKQFMARLAALDVSSFENPIDLTAGEGFWVYLDPVKNREEARRRLAELQARGVDSYIIPKGELENGISLGVFTRRDLAEARLQELSKQGLAPKLHNIERSYRELWVMLGEGEEHKIGEEAWQALMQDYISLQQRQNLCSAVASAKNFH